MPPLIGPSEPFDGPSSIESVSGSPSGSVQASGTETARIDTPCARDASSQAGGARDRDRDGGRRGGRATPSDAGVGERVGPERAGVGRVGAPSRSRSRRASPSTARRRSRASTRVAVGVGAGERHRDRVAGRRGAGDVVAARRARDGDRDGRPDRESATPSLAPVAERVLAVVAVVGRVGAPRRRRSGRASRAAGSSTAESVSASPVGIGAGGAGPRPARPPPSGAPRRRRPARALMVMDAVAGAESAVPSLARVGERVRAVLARVRRVGHGAARDHARASPSTGRPRSRA